jgi:hypothetical protein
MRRFALLNDLDSLSSHSLQHAMNEFSELLRAYHGADTCIVIINDPQTNKPVSYGAKLEATDSPRAAKSSSENLAYSLLDLPSGRALAYCGRRYFWQRTVAGAYDTAKLQPVNHDPNELARLASRLGTEAFWACRSAAVIVCWVGSFDIATAATGGRSSIPAAHGELAASSWKILNSGPSHFGSGKTGAAENLTRSAR